MLTQAERDAPGRPREARAAMADDKRILAAEHHMAGLQGDDEERGNGASASPGVRPATSIR